MSQFTPSFTQAAAQAHPPAWHRPAFGPHRLRRDKERVFYERDLLRDIFHRAQGSATARAALDWARAHRVRFMIDYTTTFGGYYLPGTGVVAIARAAAEGDRGPYGAVDVMTHEIRHAWQDHHGLIQTLRGIVVTNIAGVLIRQALIEADAYAHGRLAAAQCADAGTPVQDTLRHHFRDWYAGGMADIYGAAKRRRIGYDMGIAGCAKPEDVLEAVTGGIAEGKAGIMPWHHSDINKLGKSFAGVNYLGSWKDDRFWRRALSSSMALQLFSETTRIDALTAAICVKEARRRLVSRDPSYRRRVCERYRADARLKLPR